MIMHDHVFKRSSRVACALSRGHSYEFLDLPDMFSTFVLFESASIFTRKYMSLSMVMRYKFAYVLLLEFTRTFPGLLLEVFRANGSVSNVNFVKIGFYFFTKLNFGPAR